MPERFIKFKLGPRKAIPKGSFLISEKGNKGRQMIFEGNEESIADSLFGSAIIRQSVKAGKEPVLLVNKQDYLESKYQHLVKRGR